MRSNQVKYHHARVMYSPFGAKPGDSVVLTSDPWSYLNAHLKNKFKKARGDNRERLKRAVYFTELSEGFYKAIGATPLPGKATIVYYCMLNLAKSLISVSGKLLGDTPEHHGLSPSKQNGFDISISQRAKKSINIFHEFVKVLGHDSPVKDDIIFKECLSHMPEVHEVMSRLGLLPDNRRHMLPVEIDILSDEREEWLSTEIRYSKKHDNRLKTGRFLQGYRRAYFKDPREVDGHVVITCKRRKKFNWTNFERIYSNICKEYRAFNICAILSRDGYRFYCDLNKPQFPQLAYSLMAMFHLGTLARYSPIKTEELLEGELYPAISESLELTPRQFLYQVTSIITESVCVVPYAKV